MEASANFNQIFNFLSLTVASLCVIMKVPQIWKILKSGDTLGISLGSVLLEQCGYSMVLTYSFAMSYPLGSYLEYPFLVIQDHIVLGLIFYTRSMLSIDLFLGFLVYILAYLSIGYSLLPGFVMSFLISLCTPLGIFSKSAQILELYRRKDPGRLSIATWSIAAYGCYVRVLTSLFQTKDIFMVTNFLCGAVLNTTIIAMIVYYGRQKKSHLY